MEISLHVELVAAALKRHEEYALRDWYLLRHAGHGQGHCRVAAVREALRRLGFRRTAVDETIGRLVSSGLARIGTTGRGGHSVLVPLSLEGMMGRYGLPALRWRVAVRTRQLRGKGLRNLLFAHVQVGLGHLPKARATLRDLTGVAKTTQIRGERRAEVTAKANFVRVDATNFERMPCAAEGNRGHRTFRHQGSVYIQGPNSYSHLRIHRRKRVVRDPASHCSDSKARQPTTGTRRYFTDARKAMRQRVWHCSTGDGVVSLPVVLDEGTLRLGRETVGIWGVV